MRVDKLGSARPAHVSCWSSTGEWAGADRGM